MIESRGIVLNAVKYSDDKVIINVLTQAQGTVGFVLRRNKRTTPAVWQPLTVVNIIWHDGPGKALIKPHELSVARPWRNIPYVPHKAAIALFLGEFLGHVLRQEPRGDELVQWLEMSLAWLDEAESGYANFHIAMLFRLSRFLGFEPNVSDYTEGAFFDLRAAEFVTARPMHNDCLTEDEAAVLPRLMRLGYAGMRRVRLNSDARQRMLQVVIQYYRLHVPPLPDIKSLAVLHDVLH